MTTQQDAPRQPVGYQPPHLSESDFLRFGTFVTTRLVIRMPPMKLLMMQSRLIRRLRELGIQSFEEYRHRLFESPDAEDEQLHFIDLITTNKTEFYRETDHFEFLKQRILPSWNPAERFIVWSAGCATGEEAYTLAMILADHETQHLDFHFAVLATDISLRALECGQEAIYEESRILPVPIEQRHRYLLRSRVNESKLVRIAPELRARVHFHRLNLMEEEYPVETKIPVIFFRNVMIYFDRNTQLRVLGRLCRHLRVGGHLFISHTESIIGGGLPLLQVGPSVFRKKHAD